MITKEQANRAAKMIKVLKLAAMPGMDEIAIKLNCGLTYDQAKEALLWSLAFDVAAIEDLPLFEAAAELRSRYDTHKTSIRGDL